MLVCKGSTNLNEACLYCLLQLKCLLVMVDTGAKSSIQRFLQNSSKYLLEIKRNENVIMIIVSKIIMVIRTK